jgi:hypothetical protein
MCVPCVVHEVVTAFSFAGCWDVVAMAVMIKGDKAFLLVLSRSEDFSYSRFYISCKPSHILHHYWELMKPVEIVW